MDESVIISLLLNVLTTLIIFLPAYLANMFPVVFLKTGFLKALRVPVDMKARIFGDRILGDHKTFYGIITAMMGGAVGAPLALLVALFIGGKTSLTSLFFSNFGATAEEFALIVFIGAWIGLGAICGDMVKSFFKRRLKIASGASWLFFDQVDFVVGAWLAMIIIGLSVEIKYLIIALIITPLLHLGTNIIAYKLRLKKVWW